MSESQLDQIVKGAPPSTVTAPQVAQAARQHDGTGAIPRSDPTSLLPSSPPQIYLNLLILEASLRSQYLGLRARRRQNTFVLVLLGLWITYFGYALFLRPREDGQGVGGSVYWVVDMGEKVALISGVVTGILFWGTGQWERGVRWPRRWVGTTNRGLRSMNCKIVLIKGPWWREMLSTLSFLIPYQLFWPNPGSSYHYIDYQANERKSSALHQGQLRHPSSGLSREFIEEDVSPGGDYIKLLLLPKPFSAEFRQNWEIYRTEYWEKENERRADLRRRVKENQREIAKQEGGWFWWTGWRGWKRARGVVGRGSDIEKSHAGTHHHGHHPTANSIVQQTMQRDKKRRPSVIKEKRERSHSRSSSHSSTPTLEVDDKISKLGDQERRWSTSTTGSASGSRRIRKVPSGLQRPARLTPTNSMNSRPTTPKDGANDPPPQRLSKRASTTSMDSERSATLTPDTSS